MALERNLLPLAAGLAIGYIGASLLLVVDPKKGKEIILPLIPVSFVPKIHIAPHDPFAQGALWFKINGRRFLAVLDTGSSGIMLDRNTADFVGLQIFPRGKGGTLYFPETGKTIRTMSYRAPLTLPGVTTLEASIQVGGNNLVQPMTFLPEFDVGFEYNVIRFKEKSFGYDVSYIHPGVDKPIIPCKISNVNCSMVLDTASIDFSTISKTLAEIGIDRYHKSKVLVYNPDTEDGFEYQYFITVSIPGTSISFNAAIRVSRFQRGRHVVLAAKELLSRHIGFTLHDDGISFFSTTHP